MRRRPVRSVLRLVVATLACVIVGALLHPTTAAAARPTATSAVSSAVPEALPGVGGWVTRDQAAAWGLDDHTVTTRTTPGGSTVVFTPNAVVDGRVGSRVDSKVDSSAGGRAHDRGDDGPYFKARVRWWGQYVVYFNKLETLRIAIGTAACAAVVKYVPVIGSFLATDCALLSVLATYARARNKCLLVRGWGPRLPELRFYRGGYCR